MIAKIQYTVYLHYLAKVYIPDRCKFVIQGIFLELGLGKTLARATFLKYSTEKVQLPLFKAKHINAHCLMTKSAL